MTTTPGPFTHAMRLADCGCSTDVNATGAVIVPRRLNLCPLHAAAEEMRAFVEMVADEDCEGSDAVPPCRPLTGDGPFCRAHQARALLARIAGKE